MATKTPVAVILSDIHIGDPHGVVLDSPQRGYDRKAGLHVSVALLDFLDRLRALLANAREEGPRSPETVPYLVLAGDVWDVAIRNINEIADLSEAFFAALELERLFDQIVFLPGNHDHHLWCMTQMQDCVIRPLEIRAQRQASGTRKVKPFPHEQSGDLHLRANGTAQLEIPGIEPPYTGDIFVTGLTGGRLPVNVVYPNLYVVNDETREATLITHGHFFQPAWRIMSDLTFNAVQEHVHSMTLFYLQLLNVPITDLINYALGQMGPLADVVKVIYDQARVGEVPTELRRVLHSLHKMLDREMAPLEGDLPSRIKDRIWDRPRINFAIWLIQRSVTRWIRKQVHDVKLSARNTEDFLGQKDNATKAGEFVQLSQYERRNLKITKLVFGHTHESMPGKGRDLPGVGKLPIWNTGSLVQDENRRDQSPDSPFDFAPLAVMSSGEVVTV